MHIEVQSDYFPRLTSWHVRRALKWINPTDLEGLDCIRLLDYEPQDLDAVKHAPYLVGFLYNGAYIKRKGDRPARIALYTRDLYFGIPQVLFPSPLAGLMIGSTLAHEVGHHAVETKGYRPNTADIRLSKLIDSETERAATAYATEVVSRMIRRPYYKLGKCLARFLSWLFYEIGNRAHWKGNFKKAAALEFRAYMLNSENYDAGQSYVQDRQILLKTPSTLTDAERLWIYHRRVASTSRGQRRHDRA